jgi:hypothetical protein
VSSQGHRFSPCFLSCSYIRLGLRTSVCSHTILPISYELRAHRISIISFLISLYVFRCRLRRHHSSDLIGCLLWVCFIAWSFFTIPYLI